MLRTHLQAWRATLFVSLGLSASGCGGSAEGSGEEPLGPDTDEAPPVAADDPRQQTVTLPERLRCVSGVPSEQDPTLEQCANGIVHRPEPPEPEPCAGCPPLGPMLRGAMDICASDGDCPTGSSCILSGELQTEPLSCDNAPGGQAVSTVRRYFACQQASDECGADSQCGADEVCGITGGGRRCQALPYHGCGVPGRPFLVSGEARVAGVRAGADWAGPALEPVAGLSPAARATLAAYWLEAARMEHASVAAFARFTLQLMQLGAPFELCDQSQRAMRDETEHARRCFALASRYFGAAIGAGALPLDGALTETSLAAITRLTFIEGCLGETCAALEAAEALALASDVEVRRALALIAEDERRHAELAWRFVAWALESDATGEVRNTLRAALAELRARAAVTEAWATPAESAGEGGAAARTGSAPLPLAPTFQLTAHGLLDGEQRRRIAEVATAEVVLPCADRLLAGPARAPHSTPLTRPG